METVYVFEMLVSAYEYTNWTNYVAPELEGSSPYLQEPTIGPYPEPTGSTPHSPSRFS
jgi:hypothetical protein